MGHFSPWSGEKRCQTARHRPDGEDDLSTIAASRRANVASATELSPSNRQAKPVIKALAAEKQVGDTGREDEGSASITDNIKSREKAPAALRERMGDEE